MPVKKEQKKVSSALRTELRGTRRTRALGGALLAMTLAGYGSVAPDVSVSIRVRVGDRTVIVVGTPDSAREVVK